MICEANFLEQFKGLSESAVVLITFVAGYILNESIKAYGESKFRRFNRVLVISQIPRLIKEISDRVGEYDGYCKTMTTKASKAADIALYNQPELDILINIGYSEMNKAFFKGFFNNDINEKNTQLFSNFWESVCTLNDLNARAFNVQDSYSQTVRDYFRSCERANHQILTKIEKLIIDFRTFASSDAKLLEYIKGFREIYKNDAHLLINKMPLEVDNIYNQFIELNKIYKNVLYQYDKHFGLIELNDLLKTESNKYFIYESEVEAFKGTMLSTIEAYKLRVTYLEGFYRQFK